MDPDLAGSSRASKASTKGSRSTAAASSSSSSAPKSKKATGAVHGQRSTASTVDHPSTSAATNPSDFPIESIEATSVIELPTQAPAPPTATQPHPRRFTADSATLLSTSSSDQHGRAEYRPVLLRSPVQPWSTAVVLPPSTLDPIAAHGAATVENRYIRPVTLDTGRRSSSFSDAAAANTNPSALVSDVVDVPLSPSLAGRTPSSGMLAASRVAPYYNPSHLLSAQLNVASSVPSSSSSSAVAPTSMIQSAFYGFGAPGGGVGGDNYTPNDPHFANIGADIRQGMTSVSPTRTTFVERHSQHQQQQQQHKQRQRTLSDMHPSNFAALHTALAKAVIAAGEDDRNVQNNRKRTQSCDICRIRKVKCVRQDDDNAALNGRCKQCEANDAKCTYAYVPKKPGPQTSANSASSSSKSHARRATEGGGGGNNQGRAGGNSARTITDAGSLHGSIAQQRAAAAAVLETPSILQQLSPTIQNPNDQTTTWSSAYVQPLFSPGSAMPTSSSDTASNPFDHQFVNQHGAPPASSSYDARPDPSSYHHQLEHSLSSYTASSVSASPSAVSTFAQASQSHPTAISSSSPHLQPLETSTSSYGAPGRRSAGPSSPLASFAMTSSASAPRPQAQQQQSSASSSQSYGSSPNAMSTSVSQLGGGGAGISSTSSISSNQHLIPQSYPNAAAANPAGQHQQPPFPLYPPPNHANALFGGVAGYTMPLHSAPPTVTHFDTMPIDAMAAMSSSSSDHYHQQGIWPPRNASFSHGLPINAQQFPTPFPQHPFGQHQDDVDWQQRQSEGGQFTLLQSGPVDADVTNEDHHHHLWSPHMHPPQPPF